MATVASASPEQASTPLIEQLGHVCKDRGLPALATRLSALQAWIAEDLRGFRAELETMPRGERAVQAAAHHLLVRGGKHLRPMCVALAAKFGTGFGAAARQLAMAVELVHTATLLHDDVVDLGDVRRGAPAARALYGNAASIFAGDWLLVDALRRVRQAQVPGLLDRMLSIIEEMILAESLQLERRGRIDGDVASYFRVVEGKTAALFRWAMYAGGRVGGLEEGWCEALERFGLHLGVAFQAVDDCLDFGSQTHTGKSLFTDLREGKMTYPLILAIERDPRLMPLLQQIGASSPSEPLPDTAVRTINQTLERTAALTDTRALAAQHVQSAIDSLASLPNGDAKRALITVAEATVHREK